MLQVWLCVVLPLMLVFVIGIVHLRVCSFTRTCIAFCQLIHTHMHIPNICTRDDVLRVLLEAMRASRCRGAQPHSRQREFVPGLDCLDTDGRTALMMAVESGIENLVDLLLSAGANATTRCAAHLRKGLRCMRV